MLTNILFSPWLDSDQRTNVETWKDENLQYVKYKYDDSEGKNWTGWGRLNLITKEIKYRDPANVIAVKCSFITIFALPYAAIRGVFHCVRMVFLVVRTIIESLVSAMLDLLDGKILSAIWQRLVVEGVVLIGRHIVEQAIEVAKAPFYGVGLELAAILGLLFNPLKARARIAFIESNWNGGRRNHNGYLGIEGRRTWKEIDSFYLAPCLMTYRKKLEDIRVEYRAETYSELTQRDQITDFCVPCLPVLPCFKSCC